MWWNDPKCIHVHIPKTGGNSVTAALHSAWNRRPLAERMARRIRLGGRGPIANRRFHKHAKAQDILAVVGEPVWHDHFRFAVVRNPWDLMVSSYHWWLDRAERWESLRADARAVAALGSFPRFMDSPYGRERINEQCGDLRDWICDTEGRMLIDTVCRFERMEQDWQEITARLEIQVDLPHLNRGNRRVYRDYYDEPSRKVVAKRFAWAIECFEYRF